MDRQWRVERDGIGQIDGQQRWDRAYHLILQWTPSLVGTSPEEEDHADCPVCPGLDQSPTAHPHD